MLLFLIPADVRRALMFLPYRLQSSRGVVSHLRVVGLEHATPVGWGMARAGGEAGKAAGPVWAVDQGAQEGNRIEGSVQLNILDPRQDGFPAVNYPRPAFKEILRRHRMAV